MSTTWRVNVTKMNGKDNRYSDFTLYSDALNYYSEKISEHNISDNDCQWPADGAEVELSAGGRGYDYCIDIEEVI